VNRAGSREVAGFRRLVFCPPDAPRLLPRNQFLRDYADLPPSAPDFVIAIRVLTRWHRQRPDPPQHLDKQTPVQMPHSQQQPVVPGMLDQPPTSLDQPLLQARQRPGVDSLRQHQTTPQVAQVVGQHNVNQIRLEAAYAVPTPSFAPWVHRGGIPGCPNAPFVLPDFVILPPLPRGSASGSRSETLRYTGRRYYGYEGQVSEVERDATEESIQKTVNTRGS
jgi:hypothetical protein